MITTNIDKWLEGVTLDNHYEVYDLYTTVTSEMNMNLFHISINENYPRRLFIIPVAQDMDTLMLTDKSKPLFIRKLENKFCGGMDCQAYFTLEVEKERDDNRHLSTNHQK